MLVGAPDLDVVLAVIGGAIIAIATSLHLLLKGRIKQKGKKIYSLIGRVTGFSGIVFSLIRFEKVNKKKNKSLLINLNQIKGAFLLEDDFCLWTLGHKLYNFSEC